MVISTTGNTIATDSGRSSIAIEIGDDTYIYSLNASATGGIEGFSVGAGGTLTQVADVVDTDAGDPGTHHLLEAGTDLQTATIGGNTYLFVSATSEDAISSYLVNTDGSLTLAAQATDTANITGGESDQANGTPVETITALFPYQMEVVEIGGTTYLYTMDSSLNDVTILEVASDGSFTNQTTALGGDTAVVGGARGSLELVTLDNGDQYFYYGTDTAGDFGVIGINPTTGALTNQGTFTDPTGGGTGLTDAAANYYDANATYTDPTSGTTYFYSANPTNDRLEIWEVGTDGLPISPPVVMNTAALGGVDPNTINIQTSIDGTTYAIIGSSSSTDNLGLYVVNPDGSLTLDSIISDAAASTELGGGNSGYLVVAPDGKEYLISHSYVDRGIGSFTICFVRGTRIETDAGEVLIEDLRPGDMVRTLDHGLQPIRWIGSSTRPARGNLAPIVIRKGALGNTRDLRVSPQHRMLLTGWRAELYFAEHEVLAAAKHLVNGDTIFAKQGGTVEYFHILFDTHEVIFAEGAPSESFHPGVWSMGTLDQDQRDEIETLFPELADDADRYGPAARMGLKAHEARLLA